MDSDQTTPEPPEPAGPPTSRRGRRYNDVPAGAYAPLVDVDPRITAVLLEALSTAGVAAFVEPSPGSVGGWMEMRLPDRPTDRLWVDPERRTEARTVVAATLRETEPLLAEDDRRATRPADPGPSWKPTGGPPVNEAPRAEARDDEAVWREIVAGWQTAPDDPVPPWPVTEDLDGPGDRPSPGVPGRRVIRAADPGPLPAADDEHYVPPPPPPPPRASRHTVGACLALGFGALLLFSPGTLGQRGSDGTTAVGVGAIVGGAATLVWRMRDAPPTDSGPDDGAVV